MLGFGTQQEVTLPNTMLLIGFGPLHYLTIKIGVELSMSEANIQRLDGLFGATIKWVLVQTVQMLAIIPMMTGIRWQI